MPVASQRAARHRPGNRRDRCGAVGASRAVLDNASIFGAQLGPAEHPVFATKGNHLKDPFEMVGID